jgi:predicted nucleic acid-binding protein
LISLWIRLSSVPVDGFGQNHHLTTELRERGPRRPQELALQARLFPAAQSVPFGPEEAAVGAELYRNLPRARGREMDIAIAACAIAREAELWTLNGADYRDIPGLQLYERR